MALTWKLSEIRAKVRKLAGIPDTQQMSSDDVDSRINDFYHNRLPLEIEDKQLNEWFDLTIYATDSGDYDVSDNILKIYGNEKDNPAFIDENEIKLYQDSASFFSEYPRIDTGAAYWITSPSLCVGVSDTKKVKNSAFSYRTNDSEYTYYAAAGETALSGDTVPQNKYGAWRLEIDADGTISIVEADDNATGYATPAHAIAGLAEESDENACMGFVTVINTSGDFVPGTTALDAAGVTATYTNGFVSTRGIPEAALLESDILYIRPKPDDTYIFRAFTKIKPTALSGDDDTPLAVEWGPFIALGTAIDIVQEQAASAEVVATLTGDALDPKPGTYRYEKMLINRRYMAQFFSGAQRAEVSF